jgi:hypothetical protein
MPKTFRIKVDEEVFAQIQKQATPWKILRLLDTDLGRDAAESRELDLKGISSPTRVRVMRVV